MAQATNYVVTPFNWLGKASIALIGELGAIAIIAIFFTQASCLIFSLPLQVSKTVQQVFFIGAKSILIILLVGLFTGMVLGLQGYYTLVKFGSEGVLGAAVALSLIRELGPVMS